MRTKRNAFTLVELLVVIGIIALLISILLPSLNKARQQANLIKCQSNLHSMGQALTIYESTYKGAIPLAQVDKVNQYSGLTSNSYPGGNERQWFWMFELDSIANRNLLGSNGYVVQLSKMFTDTDTVDFSTGYNPSGVPYYWVSHYICNPRVLYAPQINDRQGNAAALASQPPIDLFGNAMDQNRKISDIRSPSTVFAIWDGPQSAVRDYNSYPVADQVDCFGMYDTGLVNSSVYNPSIDLDMAAFPAEYPNASSNGGLGSGAALQKQDNFDGGVDFGSHVGQVCFRFRHLNNTKLAALCCDGHVETRLVGAVLRRDIYTNAPGSN